MKTNETGHYKNVVGLNALKVIAENLGATYAPQKSYLQLSNLVAFVEEANAVHNAVKDQINTVTLSVDHRQLVYKNVKPLSTSVINTMGSTNVDEKTIEDAKFFNAKIQGARIGKKKTAKEGEPKTLSNSVSRQSYDSIYENFSSLNNLLIQDGKYKPSEINLDIAGLTSKLDDMKAANLDIKQQTTDLSNKRIQRNKRFYTDEDCLINIARDFKKYIRGKYGLQSAEFSQVKSIIFKDYKIK